MSETIRRAYDQWAMQYDTNKNRTRDLEAQVLREQLERFPAGNVLEIGCGTGKNTGWLAGRNTSVTAVDLSGEMLEKAKEKFSAGNVTYVQADITEAWNFMPVPVHYDLVTFSLVLEHIEDLFPVFEKAAACLRPGGILYIAELHPYKQYSGTKARFDTDAGRQTVDCYMHHISSFAAAAGKAGLALDQLEEYFDEDEKLLPRILFLLFRKP